MNQSEFLSVNYVDFIKGLLIAMVSAVVAVIGDSMSKGVFTFDWTTIWHVALSAGIGYVAIKFGSGPRPTTTPAQ
jgi:hypothetical protein